MQSVVLVTGAARGLGKEVARRLTTCGHDVIIGARDAEQAAKAAEEVGAEAPSVALDITADRSVRAATDALMAKPGRLDVLVNDAAAFPDFAETVTNAIPTERRKLRSRHRPVSNSAESPGSGIFAVLDILVKSVIALAGAFATSVGARAARGRRKIPHGWPCNGVPERIKR